MTIIIQCPHCNIQIEILELNCRIFRCGILKSNYTQIHPHLSKQECNDLITNNEIYGCGKPFQLTFLNNKWVPIICDYI